MRMPLLLGALVLAAPLSAEPAAKPSTAPIAIETITPQPQLTIDDKVGVDWPRYDVGGKGHLTRAELDKWLIDLRAAAGDTAPDAKWLGTAFGQTDTNKDKKVSRDELTAFLSSGR
jgi:hypothetical protein